MMHPGELWDWSEDQRSDYDFYKRQGLPDDEAELLVRMGITREAAGKSPASVVPFVTAAEFHCLDGVNERLLDAGGNPDVAWERWAASEPC